MSSLVNELELLDEEAMFDSRFVEIPFAWVFAVWVFAFDDALPFTSSESVT